MKKSLYKSLKFGVISLISLSIIIYFLTSLHTDFGLDESYTYALITHNFKNIISLDAMDVHPPLYYLLLKSYLLLTTFWTKSVFIKVIFSRFLSIIISIIILIYIKKVTDYCHIVTNLKLIAILLCLMPIFIKYMTYMRMYQLAALFIILEEFNILRFSKTYENRYLILAATFTVLNMYTFYFAGLSAGLYLFILSIVYLLHKKYRVFTKICIAESFCLLAYIPWLPILIKQFKYHINSDIPHHVNVLAQIISSITQCNVKPKKIVVSIIVLILLIIAIYYAFKVSNNLFNRILNLSLIDAILTLAISLFICKDEFQFTILYPIFISYSSLLFSVFPNLAISSTYNSRPFVKKLATSLLVLLSLSVLAASYINIKHYDIPSIMLQKNYNNWKVSKSKNIIVGHNKNDALNASEDAIYLKPLNKNAIITHSTYKSLSATLVNNNKNTTLTRHAFNNLKPKRY